MEYSAEKISCRFGRTRVFADLSYNIRKGEILAVTGPNGSGKTSLLKICAGVLLPSSGRISLTRDGKKIPLLPENAALITPTLRWYGALTLRENLLFYFRKKTVPDETMKCVDRFELASSLDKPFYQMSSGNAQKLSCAAVLSSGVPLLLLDEPTTHLDDNGKAAFMEILNDKRKNCAVIFATHDLSEIASATGRISLG